MLQAAGLSDAPAVFTTVFSVFSPVIRNLVNGTNWLWTQMGDAIKRFKVHVHGFDVHSRETRGTYAVK